MNRSAIFLYQRSFTPIHGSFFSARGCPRSWFRSALQLCGMRYFGFCFLAVVSFNLSAQWEFKGTTTLTWEQVIERYTALDLPYSGAKLLEIGHDDDGSPIHLFVLSDGSGFTPDSIRAAGKNILWITNAIHPGEPDGVDASLLLAQALLDSDQYMGLLANTAVCIVPVYNVSGAKERSGISRANQNGPEEYGFRGNARNLDLNRDFIKTDSRNARSLITAMDRWDPDVYFETHVSNGADHQYVMELLTTQADKQDAKLNAFTQKVLIPRLYEWMANRKIPMCSYFETEGATPEEGLTGFVDGPRYSTGHATLRQRIGILAETHMLKPYQDRVNATLQMQFATLAAMNEHPLELKEARAKAKTNAATATSFGFNWMLDTAQRTTLEWKGYAVEKVKSDVTGLERVKYDRSRPQTTTVPWLDRAKPSLQLDKPNAYLVPEAWHEVIERLQLDGVPMSQASVARLDPAEVYRITHFETVGTPYEGHYLHHGIEATVTIEKVSIKQGDWIIPMGSATDRLVMEVLEPRCADSFFAWGFFDSILQHKEWFSDYVFEDIAADLLSKDPALKSALEDERAKDPAFTKDAWAQLYFVYQRSPYFEPGYMRYPVLRLME